MFSLSMRSSPVPLQSGQRIWLSLAASNTPVLSLSSVMAASLLALVQVPLYDESHAKPNKKARGIAAGLLLRGKPGALRGLLVVEELLVFGRALERRGRGVGLDRGGHGVEVAGAHLTLVLDRREALVGGGELGLLQLDEGRHVVAGVAVGQVEH